MMDVKMHFATCFRFFCYSQDLVATRCNLMMDVKMHFATCFRFFLLQSRFGGHRV